MASRTEPHSVVRVAGPPDDETDIRAALGHLADRYPGATFHRYLRHFPEVDPSAWIAPTAALIGDVTIGPEASVWWGCILRADLSPITIGPRSNLQDGTVVHLGDADPTQVGADVVVGHRVVLHGCTIEDACLIGIGATLLDGCHIGAGSIIGAGAVVPAGTRIPPGSLVLGVPAKVVRPVGPEAARFHIDLAAKYTRLAHNHRLG
jgi:carbonic anhydrase/acetyltransferase-like protein (isoleucine patch superfamily)